MKPSGWHRKRRDTPAEQARRKEYDTPQYRARRAADRQLIDSGQARCWRCTQPIPPGTGHTGHNDNHTRVMGPEHTRCNLSEAARKGARIRNGTHRIIQPMRSTKLDW